MNVLNNVVAGLILATGTFLSHSVSAQEAPQTGPEVWKYIQSIPPNERTAVLAREAEREGGFTLYGAIGIDQLQVMQRLFQEKYPKVKMEFTRVVTSEVVERTENEARSGRVVGDGLLFGPELVELLRPHLAPFEPSAWEDIDKRFKLGSFADGSAAVSFMMTPTTIAWRTDRVKAEEAPKNLNDVADPKWKGKVGTATSILTALMNALDRDMGADKSNQLLEKLAALSPRLYESTGAASQALGSGEFDVIFNFGGDRAKQLKTAGAPVDYVLADPLYAFGTIVAPVKNANHPYSIALFVDFLTSVEGSEAYDATEHARIFGNTRGKYANDLSAYPSLKPYDALPAAEIVKLQQRVDALFVR